MKQEHNKLTKFLIIEIIASSIGIIAIIGCVLLRAVGVFNENTENIAATLIGALTMVIVVICSFISCKHNKKTTTISGFDSSSRKGEIIMNTQETRKEITIEQFLEAVKGKRCCAESLDRDVVSVGIRGCIVSRACGGVNFENMLDIFEIDENEINSIYVEDYGDFYIELSNTSPVIVSVMSEENYSKLLKNLKQILSEVSNSIIKTI